MKTAKQRWYRKWDLDISKEDVKKAIDSSLDPKEYTQIRFDGPYAPKDNDDLKGKILVFEGEGHAFSFRITDLNTLFFAEDGGEEKECYVQVRTLDKELYFLNFLVPGAETARQISLIADTVTGYSTVCDAHIGTENSNRDVGREFIFGRLKGSFKDGTPHCFTNDLIGKAVIWDYGDGGPCIKHIYNSNLYYTYMMDSPNGAWVASNPADYIKVKDNIYIFSFIEERQPGLQMLLLIYMDKLHDLGSCFGVGKGLRSACVGAVGKEADPYAVF